MMTTRQVSAGPRRGLAIAMCIWPAMAFAGAVTDGSVGPIQSLSGQFVVPQTLGTVKGGNLFHSFTYFGVTSGESATFTTSSASIQNVISRVTGGQPSPIYGPLTLQAAAGSRPDFFFINPAGVLFGAGAQIDVPGGFHVSTAQQLKFADGFVWDTGSPTVSGLTVAAPEAFGFLGGNARASVRFTSLDAFGNAGDSPSINLPAGSSFTVAAGDIELSGTTLRLPAVTAQIAAVGDRTDSVALALTDNELDHPVGGTIRFSDSTIRIDGAGTLALRAGSIDLLRSNVYSLAMALPADSSPGAVHVRAANDVWLRESQIFTYTDCSVPSSRISLVAGSLGIEGQNSGLTTTTDTGSTGNAGNIDVVVHGRMTMDRGAAIMSTTYAQGDAGAVSVKADSLELAGNGLASIIGSGAQQSSGRAGSVTVDVAGTLAITDDGMIMSVGTDGGSSGDIKVQAGTLDISCVACTGVTGIISSVGNTVPGGGDSGAIDITVHGDMRLSGYVSIESSAYQSNGRAGNIAISARSLSIDGTGGTPWIDSSSMLGSADAANIGIHVTDNMTIVGSAQISSGTTYGGRAGAVDITADKSLSASGLVSIDSSSYASPNRDAGGVSVYAKESLSLSEGASVTSGAFAGSGNAGPMILRSDGAITLTSGANVNSGTYDGSRDAGKISILADSLTLDRASIATNTVSGSGRAGIVDLQIGHGLVMNNQSSISSATYDSGDGRAVNIRAGDVSIASGSYVSADTLLSRGAAGNIAVTVNNLSIDGGGVIGSTGIFASASARSSGQTGHIDVGATGQVALRNGGTIGISNGATVADPNALTRTTLKVSANDILLDRGLITAQARGNTHASNVELIAANNLTLKSSNITTSAVDGNGGDIRIAGKTIRLADSLVTTSVLGAANGNGGNIRIAGNALILKSGFILANTLAPLAQGGNITIDTLLLIPEGGTLAVGGGAVQTFRSGYAGFNVIQAAAPDGVAGDLQITTPELNLAGTLSGFATPVVDFGPMARDQCRTGAGSSFTLMGSGAAPGSVADLAEVAR